MKHQALKRPTSQKTPLSTSGLQRQAVRKVSEEELQTLSATQDRGFAQDFSQIPASTAGMPFQAKLSVGAAGDKYEQEADQVAAAVVDQLHSPTSDSGTNQQFVQREDAEEEELQMKPDSLQREDAEEEELQMKSDSVQREDAEEEELQMKSDSVQREDAEEEELQTKPDSVQREDAEEEELQTKPDSVQREDAEEEELQMKPTLQRMGAEGGPVSDDIETEIQSARGGGQALAPDLQAQMGQAMGADFSGVRVHTDARADVLNRSVGARAFTTGQDLFFKQGEYQPGSKNGQELIAHELTHVKQQNGNTISRKITPEEYKGSNHDTQELKDAYNAAWEHLWPSPQARLIYEVVDSHPKDIKILVGWNEGSVATENEVKWNPSESYFHTTETTQEMYMANNGDVTLDENNVQSQTSSALTLMHELGHVKQRIEAQEAQEAAGTAKGGSRVGGAKKANWEHSLDRIVSKVMDRCKSYMGQDAFLNDDLNPDKAGKGSALERDNVTRHERPVGQEVGEASRPSYQNSAPEDFVTDDPNDEIRQQVTLHRQETLVEQVVHNTPQLGKGGKQADEDIWTVKTWLTDVANTLKQLKVKKKLEKSRDEDVAAIELMIASLQQLEDKDQLRLGEIGEEMKEEKEPDIPKW